MRDVYKGGNHPTVAAQLTSGALDSYDRGPSQWAELPGEYRLRTQSVFVRPFTHLPTRRSHPYEKVKAVSYRRQRP